MYFFFKYQFALYVVRVNYCVDNVTLAHMYVSKNNIRFSILLHAFVANHDFTKAI